MYSETEEVLAREATNELTFDENKQFSANLGLNLLSAVKAEVAAQVSRQVGSRVGENRDPDAPLHRRREQVRPVPSDLET